MHMRDIVLQTAVMAAREVAVATARSPADAAVQIVSAYLIACAQFDGASKAPISDGMADALLRSAGLTPVDEQTQMAMRLFGLQPLLKLRPASTSASLGRPGWFRRWMSRKGL